ncbi:hypothetical protein HIM_05862 [Hirsutella minnesotensis 3608]|uniref:Uncharacterized protein n=1 Tax=Hirsutella minnesotensis 3608 TaxID=1043627 RepID=A0A0F7ZP22_9HYPO|nr:hypothetical protein HIM_05862 [Hirsutella minnesotensis 3608]
MDPREDFYPETPPILPRPKPMKTLGLRPYHFSEISRNKNNRHFEQWLAAVRAKYDGVGRPWRGADFDRLLWDYDALSDDPCCLFVEDLVAAYPDARVVLTLRPRDAWLRSMRAFILGILSWRSWPVLCLLDGDFSAPYQALLRRTTAVLLAGGGRQGQGQGAGHASADSALLASFDAHADRVRRAVPPDRLLELRPGDGWEPLCEFLDVPVPAGEYPHLNKAGDAMRLECALYWSRWYSVAQRLAKKVGVLGLVLVAALWAGWVP